MFVFSRPLGDAVKRARGRSGISQRNLAYQIGMDARTLLNIENYKGNPLMENLYPLVRALNIDPREIFYPEMLRDTPALQRIRRLVEDCNEEDAELLIPVIESILTALHSKQGEYISTEEKSQLP